MKSITQRLVAWVHEKSAPGAGSAVTFEDVFGTGSNKTGDLTQPYKNSAFVMRAIKHCSGPIASVPVVITQDKRGGDKRIEDSKLTAFLERPAKTSAGRMSFEDFIDATVGWLKLEGETFWICDDSWLIGGADKNPVIVARPEQMRPILDESRELVGWSYTDDAGMRHPPLITEQVVFLSYWNPYDKIRGLAEWEAARIASAADYAQGTFARNLAQNNGDRGPYVIGKGGNISADQREQITTVLRQKRERSRAGDFRPVFLTGDVDIKEPQLQAVDSAYAAQRLGNRHEIFIAFGVPPSFADLVASYSVGSASDRFRLIEDTCMPLARKISGGLEQLIEMFLPTGGTYFAQFDFDEHSTMQQVRGERMDSAIKAIEHGMPWTVANETFRLKLPRFKGDDVGRVPFNLTEIGGIDKPEDEPAPKKSVVDELSALFNARNKISAAPVQRTGKSKAGLWAQIHKARQPWEKRIKSKVSRFLMEARRETLANIAKLDDSGTKSVVTKDGDVLSLLWDLAPWLTEWTQALSEIDRAAMEAAGLEWWTVEGMRDDPLTMPAAQVQVAMANRENRIRTAGQLIFDKIQRTLEAGYQAGDSTKELSDRVRVAFNGIDATQAEAIAITETTFAYETGRRMAMKTGGVQYKQWLGSGDGRERLTHLGANDQIQTIDEPFVVGGFEMMHPGDPTAPAKEVIRCRCVAIAVAGPDGGDIEGNSDENEIPY